ncbi:MAG: YeeE/YedE family protein [Cyclobacteriaceae bacterium]
MKALRYIVTGIFFGIVLTKSQVISWFRIYEMFSFESFHMYGVIGSAVVLGILGVQLIKKLKLKDWDGSLIFIKPKAPGFIAPIFGGVLFGLGWAFTGACPGPIYIIIGNGYSVFIAVLLAAILGAFVQGLVNHKLPR